jgi:acyl-CoA reductase-like NAD-dependent aldehyde dehydrogenase
MTTPIEEIPIIVEKAKETSSKATDVAWRIQQLKQIYQMVEENEQAIYKALYADLRKCSNESYMFEVLSLKNDIAYFLANLKSLTKPQRVPGQGLANLFDRCEIRYEPLGTVLIIGPWNYPVLLVLQPLVAAIAAGNAVVVKPSEVAPATATLLTSLLTKYCDNDVIKIINGGPKETTRLLELKFDYIFYTGNGNIGRIVYKAAAEHLTPVTLELGGKSPVIIDKNVDPDVVAKRIVWAKFINSGQTCIAPDYILVDKAIADSLVDCMKKAIIEFHGEDIKKSSTYSRIINRRHFDRLKNLYEAQLKANPNCSTANGGKMDPKDLFISPTIITGVGLEREKNPIMNEEIFGPLLPVIPIENVDVAIKYINSREHPLALYTFSRDSKFNEKVLKSTHSGHAMVNDLFLAMTVATLPFGGVGDSGMGSYHGKHGFETFSHKRGVMHRPAGLDFVTAVRYPHIGYTQYGFSLLKFLMESWRPRL